MNDFNDNEPTVEIVEMEIEKPSVKWLNAHHLNEVYILHNRKKEESDKYYTKLMMTFSRAILANSSLKWMIVYARENKIAYYDVKKNIYVLIDEKNLSDLVAQLLRPYKMSFLLSKPDYNFIASDMVESTDRVTFKPFQRVGTIIPFSDCNWDIRSKVVYPLPDYNHLIDYRLPFPYHTDEKCPQFDQFMWDLAEHHKDRDNLVRCYLSAIIMIRLDMNNWIHVYGESYGGKSISGHIIHYLTGEEATCCTTIEQLSTDKFEIQHLANARLILCSETLDWSKDLELLKKASGADGLPVRKKHENHYSVIHPAGKIMLIGNYPLRVRDSGNAIRNRHLFLKVSVGDKGKVPLFGRNPLTHEWEGPMLHEMAAIHKSLREMDQDLVTETLTNFPQSCPSQLEEYEILMDTFNPLQTFVEECIEPGEKSFLGSRPKQTAASLAQARLRGTLYPAYQEFCSRRGEKPVSFKTFSGSLLSCCKRCEYAVSMGRNSIGRYVNGIKLISNFWDADLEHGGTVGTLGDSSTPPEVGVEKSSSGEIDIMSQYKDSHGNWKVDVSGKGIHLLNTLRMWSSSRHESIDEFSYEHYLNLYKSSQFKTLLNSLAKVVVDEPSFAEACVRPYVDLSPIQSEEFTSSVENTIVKDLNQIKSFGITPKSYKFCGTSPRLQPTSGEFSFNSIKRSARSTLFTRLGDLLARKLDYVIVDYDIKSCYTAVLLGLFPDFLPDVITAVNGPGLWKHFEEEFRKKNYSQSFHKDSVKVCVYASFFQGGNQAMTSGILEKFRLNAGLTLSDFKKTGYYQDCLDFSKAVVVFMKEQRVIQQFQECSSYILKEYEGSQLKGVTGYWANITKDQFRKQYSCYLQTYEIGLMMETFRVVKERFPEVEFIVHMHDGCTVAMPRSIHKEVTGLINSRLDEVRNKMGLTHKVQIETQGFFGKVEHRDWKDRPELGSFIDEFIGKKGKFSEQ